jgi:glutathione S-transferase
MIKLYGVRTSPYVRHARIALAESGLQWQLEQVTSETIIKSPTRRVPFLTDGELILTDSSVIVRYIREKAGQPFLEKITDHELFALSTSVLDTAVNVFLMNVANSADLEAIASGPSTIGFSPRSYFESQQARIGSGIQGLNDFKLSHAQPYNDGEIRLACLLDWAIYRGTIDISGLEILERFLGGIRDWAPFTETAPNI